MKKLIPNCAICKWVDRIGFAVIGTQLVCNAQADRMCNSVYNNKLCKQLFEVRK
jgi:hypothetical protein